MGKVGNAGRERDKLRKDFEKPLFLDGHKTPRGIGFFCFACVLRPAIRPRGAGLSPADIGYTIYYIDFTIYCQVENAFFFIFC